MQTDKQMGASDGLKAVRMYPNNRLRAQVRPLGDNLSAFDVLKDAFKAE